MLSTNTKRCLKEHLKEKLIALSSENNDEKLTENEQQQLSDYWRLRGLDIHAPLKPASVLILLATTQNNIEDFSSTKTYNLDSLNVILTRRATHLKHHAGEISFPGGRQDPSDQSLAETALRETREEIGIAPDQIHLLGKLTQQKTTSQYQVTPFVGIINDLPEFICDPNEVAEAFTVPLTFLCDAKNHKKESFNLSGRSFSYWVIQYNDYRIWGATARMLVNLSKALRS